MKNRISLLIAAFLFTAAVNAQSTVDSIAAKYKLVPMPEPLTIEKTFPVLGTYQLGNTDVAASSSVTTTTDNAANSSVNTTSPAAQTSTSSTAVGTEAGYTGSVSITLDQENKGLVWVEGLPQGKFKAYLRKSPSTYRILAQKTESGEQIPEGTLMYDPETKMLNIALGKAYDDADPAAIFALNPALNPTSTEPAPAENTVKIKTKTATSKTKAKVTYYTASKIEQTPASTTTTSDATTAPATQQPEMQQQQPTPAPAPAPAPQQ
jgi:hypothetical protein